MTATRETLLALADDVRETGAQLVGWARGPENIGQLSQEAYHICVHIDSALTILASKIEARAQAERTPPA